MLLAPLGGSLFSTSDWSPSHSLSWFWFLGFRMLIVLLMFGRGCRRYSHRASTSHVWVQGFVHAAFEFSVVGS